MGNIFFTLLYQPLYNFLVFLYGLFPQSVALGIAIILITLIVKIILLPLTYQSLKAQKDMQDIQPKIAEIRARLKDDKEAMAKELMDVYKKNNVNPFASCLPAIVQMFVFIALYQVLSAGFGDVNSTVLYSFVHNPGTLNSWFLGMDLHVVSPILGIVAGVAQYVQARQMVTQRPVPAVRNESSAALDEDMTAAMNKSMLYVLPVMMLVLGATTLPAGLTLYIIISTLSTFVLYAVFLGKKRATMPA